MNITLKTPNTVVLSIWYMDSTTAITGFLRRSDGTIIPDAIAHSGGYIWQVLDEVLEQAKLLKMHKLLMLCNDEDMARILSRPVCIHQPHSVPYKIGRYKEVHTIPAGGCQHLWSILRHTMYYDGWRMAHTDKIKKAKEYWSQLPAAKAASLYRTSFDALRADQPQSIR